MVTNIIFFYNLSLVYVLNVYLQTQVSYALLSFLVFVCKFELCLHWKKPLLFAPEKLPENISGKIKLRI